MKPVPDYSCRLVPGAPITPPQFHDEAQRLVDVLRGTIFRGAEYEGAERYAANVKRVAEALRLVGALYVEGGKP